MSGIVLAIVRVVEQSTTTYLAAGVCRRCGSRQQSAEQIKSVCHGIEVPGCIQSAKLSMAV